MFTIRRLAVVTAGSLTTLACVTVGTPAVGNAAECGPGTYYDAPTNSCVVAQPPPPPAPPPPAWNGDITPYFSVGTCIPIPIPFAPSVCAGI